MCNQASHGHMICIMIMDILALQLVVELHIHATKQEKVTIFVKDKTIKTQGYSLIELVTTVLIIAIILAFALYSYRDFTDKAKIEEAARLAYEMRQHVDIRVSTKRDIPTAITRTYVNMAYVEKAEAIPDGSDAYRINVYFKREAFPESNQQKVFTLYGNLIDNHVEWTDCDRECVKNDIDIPPVRPTPPGSGSGGL